MDSQKNKHSTDPSFAATETNVALGSVETFLKADKQSQPSQNKKPQKPCNQSSNQQSRTDPLAFHGKPIKCHVCESVL